jgi:RNA polymerase sigma-70 factor (ECF subfamily)
MFMRVVSGNAGGMCSDELRFAELYARCRGPIVDYCRRRLASDAVEDAVADTFLVVWRRLDEVPDAAALLWTYAVAYRVVGHYWRGTARRRRLQVRLNSIAPGSAVAADESCLAGEEGRRVLAALAELSGTDAEVLRLATWEELSVAEISAVLGIVPNAVRQRLHRAHRSLAAEYERLRSCPTSSRANPTEVSGDHR